MKKFSLLSISLMVIGLLLFGINWIREDYSEPLVLAGFLSFLAGIAVSLIAMVKQEEGALKFISPISFFIIMFLLTWFEPFHFLRMITWLKNVS